MPPIVFGPERIGTVFADPPFSLGKDYGNGADKDEPRTPVYFAWRHEWIDEKNVPEGQEAVPGALCAPVLHEGGPEDS